MKQQDQKLLIGLAAIAVGYFGVIRPILKKIGIQKSQEDIAHQKELDAEKHQAVVKAQQQAASTGVRPTKSDAEWQTIADIIYEDLRYAFYADKQNDAIYQVCRVKNIADYWVLYRKFKKRRDYVLGIPQGELKDLPGYLAANLNRRQLDVINDNYRRKGINIRF